jgi:peptidoglycan hydrolase-like protein with peptidoglycan-binding domain
MLVFSVYILLQRPFGALLGVLCLWSGAHVAQALMEQAGPHPAPLFAKQNLLTARTSLPPLPAKLFEASYEQQDEAQDIRAAQIKLSQLGFYKGASDGRMGPRTIEAVRTFQAKSGLEASGVIDASTKARLQEENAPGHSEDGDILIFTVQHRLNELGFDAGEENGKLTQKTQASIRKFELAHSLPVTGAIRGQLLKVLTAKSVNIKQ